MNETGVWSDNEGMGRDNMFPQPQPQDSLREFCKESHRVEVLLIVKTGFRNDWGQAEGRHRGSAGCQREPAPGKVKGSCWGKLGKQCSPAGFPQASSSFNTLFLFQHYSGLLPVSYLWNLPKESPPTVKSYPISCSLLFCCFVFFSELKSASLK